MSERVEQKGSLKEEFKKFAGNLSKWPLRLTLIAGTFSGSFILVDTAQAADACAPVNAIANVRNEVEQFYPGTTGDSIDCEHYDQTGTVIQHFTKGFADWNPGNGQTVFVRYTLPIESFIFTAVNVPPQVVMGNAAPWEPVAAVGYPVYPQPYQPAPVYPVSVCVPMQQQQENGSGQQQQQIGCGGMSQQQQQH